MTKPKSIPAIFAFVAILCSFNSLNAQNDLTEEWEVHYQMRQPPDKILEVIGAREGMTIGEIGAGRGRITVYMARKVGEKGRIYANDVDENALSYLKGRSARQGFRNIITVNGMQDDPRFPDNSLDLAVMILVYHMIENPDNLLRNIKNGLKPGAQLVIIDPADSLVDMEFGVDRSKPGNHPALIKDRIIKSAHNAGYELVRTDNSLPQDVIYFLKPTDREKRISAAALARDKILQSGIAEGNRLFAELRKDTANYNLDEQTFMNAAYEFYGRRTLPEAVAVLNMGAELYPESAKLHFSLGEMYLINGEKEKSRASFSLANKNDPGNKATEYVLTNLDEIYNQMHPQKK